MSVNGITIRQTDRDTDRTRHTHLRLPTTPHIQ